MGENKWSSFWSLVLLLFLLVSFPLGQHLIHIRRGSIATVVSVQPARRCTSPFGVVLVGSGDGAGDCHDAANLSKERLFISPLFLGGRCAFFRSMFFLYYWMLLDMLCS